MPQDGRAPNARPKQESTIETTTINFMSKSTEQTTANGKRRPPPPPPSQCPKAEQMHQQNRYLDSCGSSDSGQGTLESSSSSRHRLYLASGSLASMSSASNSPSWPTIFQRQWSTPSSGLLAGRQQDHTLVCSIDTNNNNNKENTKVQTNIKTDNPARKLALQQQREQNKTNISSLATTATTTPSSRTVASDDEVEDEEDEEEDEDGDGRVRYDSDILSKLTRHQRRKSSSIFTSSCSNSSSVVPSSSPAATTNGQCSSSSSSCCSSAAGLNSHHGSMSSFASDLPQRSIAGQHNAQQTPLAGGGLNLDSSQQARTSRSPSDCRPQVMLRERRRSSWLGRSSGCGLADSNGELVRGQRCNVMSASLEQDEDELELELQSPSTLLFSSDLPPLSLCADDDDDERPFKSATDRLQGLSVGPSSGALLTECRALKRAIDIGAENDNAGLGSTKSRSCVSPPANGAVGDPASRTTRLERGRRTPSGAHNTMRPSRLTADGNEFQMVDSGGHLAVASRAGGNFPSSSAGPFCYCSEAGNEQNAQTSNSREQQQQTRVVLDGREQDLARLPHAAVGLNSDSKVSAETTFSGPSEQDNKRTKSITRCDGQQLQRRRWTPRRKRREQTSWPLHSHNLGLGDKLNENEFEDGDQSSGSVSTASDVAILEADEQFGAVSARNSPLSSFKVARRNSKLAQISTEWFGEPKGRAARRLRRRQRPSCGASKKCRLRQAQTEVNFFDTTQLCSGGPTLVALESDTDARTPSKTVATIEGALRLAEFYPVGSDFEQQDERNDADDNTEADRSAGSIVVGRLLVCLDLNELERDRLMESGLIGGQNPSSDFMHAASCHSARRHLRRRHSDGMTADKLYPHQSPGGSRRRGADAAERPRVLLIVRSELGPTSSVEDESNWLLAADSNQPNDSSSSSSSSSYLSGNSSPMSTTNSSSLDANQHNHNLAFLDDELNSSSSSSITKSSRSTSPRRADRDSTTRLSAATRRRACFWRLVASASDSTSSSQAGSGDELQQETAAAAVVPVKEHEDRQSRGRLATCAQAGPLAGAELAEAGSSGRDEDSNDNGAGGRLVESNANDAANRHGQCPLASLFYEATDSNPNNRPKLVLMASKPGAILTSQLSGPLERADEKVERQQSAASCVSGNSNNNNNAAHNNNEALVRLNSIHEQQEELPAGGGGASLPLPTTCSDDRLRDNETLRFDRGPSFKAPSGCQDNESVKGRRNGRQLADGPSDNNDEDGGDQDEDEDVEAEVELKRVGDAGEVDDDDDDDDYFYDEELSFNQNNSQRRLACSARPQQQQTCGGALLCQPETNSNFGQPQARLAAAAAFRQHQSSSTTPQPISATERFLAHLSIGGHSGTRPLLVWAPTARRVSCPVGQLTSFASWRQLWSALPPEPAVFAATAQPAGQSLCSNCLASSALAQHQHHHQQNQQQQQQLLAGPHQNGASSVPWEFRAGNGANKLSRASLACSDYFSSFDQSEVQPTATTTTDCEMATGMKRAGTQLGASGENQATQNQSAGQRQQQQRASLRGDGQTTALRRRALDATHSMGVSGAAPSSLLRSGAPAVSGQHLHNYSNNNSNQYLNGQQVELPPLELRRQSTITGFDHYRHTAPRSPSLCLPHSSSSGHHRRGGGGSSSQGSQTASSIRTSLAMPCAATSGRLLLSPTHSTGGSSSPSPTSWHQNGAALINAAPNLHSQLVAAQSVRYGNSTNQMQLGSRHQFGRARLESLESDRGSSPSWTASTTSLRSSIGGGSSSIYSALNLAHMMATSQQQHFGLTQQQILALGQPRKRSSGSICSTASSSGVSSIAGVCPPASSTTGGGWLCSACTKQTGRCLHAKNCLNCLHQLDGKSLSTTASGQILPSGQFAANRNARGSLVGQFNRPTVTTTDSASPLQLGGADGFYPIHHQEQAVYFFLCCCQGSKSSRNEQDEEEEEADEQQQQRPEPITSGQSAASRQLGLRPAAEPLERRVSLMARPAIVGADEHARPQQQPTAGTSSSRHFSHSEKSSSELDEDGRRTKATISKTSAEESRESRRKDDESQKVSVSRAPS